MFGKHDRGEIPVYARRQKYQPVTSEFLAFRAERSAKNGFPKAKWVQFCERLLREGLCLTLYEAKRTHSKYVTVTRGDRVFKVRFSDHRPIRSRELAGDCDVFVGKTHTGWRTTQYAIDSTLTFFGIPLDSASESR